MSLVATLVLLIPAVASLGPGSPLEVAVPAAEILDPALGRLLVAGAADLPVIVRFTDHTSLLDHLEARADRPFIPFHTLPGVAYKASVEEVRALATMPGVAYIEHDAMLPVLLDSAVVASRAAAVWGGTGAAPILHPATGEVIDGRGIGVAVIDTGADGTNPNLAPAIVSNLKVVSVSDIAAAMPGDPEGRPEWFLPMEDTDVGSGHGTHVSGIVAARGIDGPRGAAPGAGLYVFSAGAGLHVITSFATASFDWIIQNGASADPPIHVITNSYGNVGAYNPQSAIAIMTTKAVEAGLSVVFAAGNGDTLGNGGDGSDNRLTAHAQHPLPGVVGVANYDDAGNGTRDGALHSSSSRGRTTDPSTWPDISAPGTDIVSTMSRTDPIGWVTLSPLIDPTGNPFGNAVSQWWGDAWFDLGDPDAAVGSFNHYMKPAISYNAHDDTFLFGSKDSPVLVPDPSAKPRHYGPVDEPIGPVHPMTDAARHVSPGDMLHFVKDGGTAQRPVFQIIAPSGAAADIYVPFDCRSGCSASVDLHALFAGEPSDGTWTVSYGRTVRTEADFHTSSTGTSMAAPHVAGIIAMMYQANGNLTPGQVETILKETAYPFVFGAPYTPHGSHDKGHGLVDAHAAVQAALVAGPPDEDDSTEPPIEPVDPIRVTRWEGHSVVDSWPHTAPGRHAFDVRQDDVGILVELRWAGILGQGVDVVVTEPRTCSIGCLAELWATKGGHGTHRADGSTMPSDGGELRLWLDETVVQGVDCSVFVCTWHAEVLPTLAVQVGYDMRVTVVNSGELPEGYTAFG